MGNHSSISRWQADARALSVLQDTIWHRDAMVCTLPMYFHLFSGMGFSQRSLPACRFAYSTAAAARGWSIVLVSERISSVVDGPSTDGFAAQSFSRAVPRSVPLPYMPESRT